MAASFALCAVPGPKGCLKISYPRVAGNPVMGLWRYGRFACLPIGEIE